MRHGATVVQRKCRPFLELGSQSSRARGNLSNDKQRSISRSYIQPDMIASSAVTAPFSVIRNFIKDGLDIINFRKKAKLAPTQWLILAKQLATDQIILDLVVQQMAPFVRKWEDDKQAEYTARVSSVNVQYEKGLEKLRDEAHKNSRYDISIMQSQANVRR